MSSTLHLHGHVQETLYKSLASAVLLVAVVGWRVPEWLITFGVNRYLVIYLMLCICIHVALAIWNMILAACASLLYHIDQGSHQQERVRESIHGAIPRHDTLVGDWEFYEETTRPSRKTRVYTHPVLQVRQESSSRPQEKHSATGNSSPEKSRSRSSIKGNRERKPKHCAQSANVLHAKKYGFRAEPACNHTYCKFIFSAPNEY